MKYDTPVTKEELEEAVQTLPVYKTADFEFVAVALVLQDPPVKLIGKEPFDHPTMQQGKMRRKFLFVLAPPPGKVVGDDWENRVSELALRYVNKELLVEPTSVAATRKYLRGYLWDASPKQQKR